MIGLLKNKAVILTTIISIAIYAAFIYSFRTGLISAEKIQDLAFSFGLSGFITVFFIQFFMSMTPLPDSFVAVLGIVLYGPWVGTILVYLGMTCAAIVHYFIARKMGVKYVMKHVPEAMPYIEKFGKKDAFIKLAVLRVVDVFSFDIEAYIAGVAGVDFKTYLLSTLVGLIPLQINNILIARGIHAQSWDELGILAAVYIGFAAVTWIVSTILKKAEGLPD